MISQLFGPRRRRPVGTYVALGDSFTAGNGCDPRERWADLVADGLRAENPGLEYFNLARDGADSHDVLAQVPAAVSARADLVTLVCGANDVILNLRPDIAAFTGRFELMLDRLRRTLPGVAILTATYPEGWRLEGIGPRTQSRIQGGMRELNGAIREVSAARIVPCLETVDHPGIADPANFEPDGLHPSPAGHVHAATEFRRALAGNFSIQTTNRRQRQWR